MPARLSQITFLVKEYDEAIAWFQRCLDFRLIEDADLGGGKRWVVVEPPGGGTNLLLARALGEDAAVVGRQAGGRVFLFLYTDDFAAEHRRMSAEGVRFYGMPRVEPYGTVAVFEDLYGNYWDLIETRSAADLPAA